MTDKKPTRDVSDEELSPVQRAADVVAKEAKADVLFLNGQIDDEIRLALHQQAFEAFEHFLLQTKFRSGGDITTKTATSSDRLGW